MSEEYSGGLMSEHRFPETDKRPVIFPNVDASNNGKAFERILEGGERLMRELTSQADTPYERVVEKYRESVAPIVDSDESETGRKVSER